MVQFERKFFKDIPSVGDFVEDKITLGGSWKFEVEPRYEDDDCKIIYGYEVVADPVCTQWVLCNSDGYEACYPAGITGDAVEGCKASVERLY